MHQRVKTMKIIYVDNNIPKALAVKALRPIWEGVVWSPIAPFGEETIPEPDLPGSSWLRVQNLQCGICSTDINILKIKLDPKISAIALPGNNRVYLGHEAVGKVTETGSDVQGLKVGQRVVMESKPFGSPNCHTQEIEPICSYCRSGATRLCTNASLGMGLEGVGGGWGDGYTTHETEVWPVPDDLSNDQASMIEPMAVALHGVLRRPPHPGEKVLVIGAGIIGLLTLQCLKAVTPDVHVTILARYPQQIKAAERFGADEIVTGENVYLQLAHITGAKYYSAPFNRGMMLGGYNIVYDCVGSADTIWDGLRWTMASGSLVLIGTSLDTIKVDLSPVYIREVDIIGSITFGVERWKGREAHTFELVIDMLQSGELSIDGLITHRFPFDDYRKAVQAASDKSTGAIKVTLVD